MSGLEQASVAASGIKKGQRGRVVLEGEIEHAPGVGRFYLGRGSDRNVICENAEHVVSVEVLPDPERKWWRGDVVLDAMGQVYVRPGEDRWRHLPQGAGAYLRAPDVGHDFPVRPLTLLVRDGKPVTS